MENKTKTKKSQTKKAAANFKKRYFDFYDDVKDPTHKIVDW